MNKFTIPQLFFMSLCMIAGSWLSAVSFGLCALINELKARHETKLKEMNSQMMSGQLLDGSKVTETMMAVSAHHGVLSITFMGSIILAIFGV